MIQASELRIGNWVFDDENIFCQISGLNSVKKAKFEDWDTQYGADGPLVEYPELDGIYISQVINPIPLTPELLVKCGFMKVGLPGSYYQSYRRSVNTMDELAIYTPEWVMKYQTQGSGFARSLEHVKHLHDLQNWWHALTGTELEVNL